MFCFKMQGEVASNHEIYLVKWLYLSTLYLQLTENRDGLLLSQGFNTIFDENMRLYS